MALGEIDLRLRHRGVPGEEDLVEGAADALPVVEILDPELPQLLLHQLQLALGLLPQRRLDARRPLPDAGPAQLELLEEEAPHGGEAVLLGNHGHFLTRAPG